MSLAEGLTRLLAAFDCLEIHYMVGGSAASGLYGHVRVTRDIDIVARIRMEDIGPLVEALEADFYIDADQIRSAIGLGRSFNLVHFQSSFKFDVFPLAADRYQQVQFARRRFEVSNMFGPEPVEFAVAAPEDVILSKLRWYKLGGGVSEQQWNDVLGVIAVQGERLDLAYMREWADYLKVADLLEQAINERHEERD
jgi:hypothetical protein